MFKHKQGYINKPKNWVEITYEYIPLLFTMGMILGVCFIASN